MSFADPDAAVDEKIREMELSETAIDIDETVRASKVADSNVREQVKHVVEATVDGDDGNDPEPTSTADAPREHGESEPVDDRTPADEPNGTAGSDGQLSLEDLQ